MKLLKGAFTDCQPNYQPDNTWRHAHNLVYRNGALHNEEGVHIYNLVTNFYPIGECLLPDNSLLTFMISNDGLDNKIVRLTGKNVYTTITDFNFGFSVDYPIRAAAEYLGNGDIQVVFTDNYNKPRYITIDKDTGLIKETSLAQTQLFPSIRVPNFQLLSTGGGGSFAKGMYQMSIAYKFIDGGYTNYIGLSRNILIPARGGSMSVEIHNLDPLFTEFKIGLVANIEGVVSAFEGKFDVRYNSGDTSIIVNLEEGTPIALEEITQKIPSWDRIGDIAKITTTLYAADLTRNVQPEGGYTWQDFQSDYVNFIGIGVVREDELYLDDPVRNYENPTIIFNKVGFMDNEVYAFYLRLYGLDGSPIADFHIPHNVNCTTTLAQNQNERYPDNSGYPDIDNPGTPDKVRHHKISNSPIDDFVSSTGNPFFFLLIESDGWVSQPPSLSIYALKFTVGENTSTELFGQHPDYGNQLNSYYIFAPGERKINIQIGRSNITNTHPTEIANVRIQVLSFDASDDPITLPGKDSNVVFTEDMDIDPNGTQIINTVSEVLNQTVLDGARILFLVQLLNANVILSGGDVTGTFSFTVNEIETPAVVGDFVGKPTALAVTNIQIPQEVRAVTQGFEIVYAKRSGFNNRIITQGLLYDGKLEATNNYGKSARFTSFDLLLDKPPVKPDKVELLYEFDLGTTTSDRFRAVAALSPIYTDNVIAGKYIPNDNSAADNIKGEEHYKLNLENDLPSTYYLHGNLINNKQDFYTSFEGQIIVATGLVCYYDEVGDTYQMGSWTRTNPGPASVHTYRIDKLYGGDTYHYLYQVRLTRPQKTGNIIFWTGVPTEEAYKGIVSGRVPVKSSVPGQLRTWETTPWYKTQPSVSATGFPIFPGRDERVAAGFQDPDTSDSAFLEGLWGTTEPAARMLEDTKRYNIYLELDRGFRNLNDKIQGVPIQGEEIEDYYTRIIRTQGQSREATISSWRKFLPANYYEQNRDRGRIINLAVIDTDKLIIHHERGLFLTKGQEKLATNISEIVIGAGDIFAVDPKEPIFAKQGYLGTRHKFGNTTLPTGYIFFSDEKIYMFNTGELKEITKLGKKEYFLEFLRNVGDNPYKYEGSVPGGISCAWDDKNERVLISVVKPTLDDSETWSFSKDLNAFVGTHDYDNCKLVDITNDVLLFHNKQVYKLGRDRDEAFAMGLYYGVKQPAFIDICFATPEDVQKLFFRVSWNTIVKEFGSNYQLLEETFDTIILSNDRYSQEYDLVNFADPYSDYTIRKGHNIWNFNLTRLEDAIKTIDTVREAKKFTDEYLRVKLVYDNDEDHLISFNEVSAVSRIIPI